jgi:tetratricopeptide (TPR) repeat protein
MLWFGGSRNPLMRPGWGFLLWTMAGAVALIVAGGGVADWATLLRRDGLWLGAWWLALSIRDGADDAPTEALGFAAAIILASVTFGWLQWAEMLPSAFNPFGERDFTGALGLSNFTAEWSIVATLLLAGLWAGRDGAAARRWLIVAAVPVGGFAVAAGARTAMVAAAAAFIVPFLLSGVRTVRYVWFLALAAMAGLALMWLEGDAPLRYRLLLADQSLALAAEAPLGVGPGRISEGLDRVLSPELDQMTWEIENAITHAHNLFVEALAERGWVGLLLLAVFALWWLEKAAEAQARGDGLLVAAGVAWWVIAMASLASAVAPLWWLGGLALALVALPAQDSAVVADRAGMGRRAAGVALGVLLFLGALTAWYDAGTARLERASVRLLREGRTDEAEIALRKALTRRPDDALMLYRLGQLRIIQGSTADALSEFARAAAARPTWARPHEATTLAATDAGRFETALASAEIWLEMPGWRDPLLWHAAASAAWSLGRREEAAAWIAGGLAEHPDHAVLLRLRASIAALEGRWADAEADYTAVAGGPDGTARDRELAEVARRRR